MTKKNHDLPDLNGLDYDELTSLLNDLVDQHQQIALKITTAKALAKREGVYMDAGRFHNINYAKIMVNSKIRKIEQELQRRRIKRGNKTLGDFFMEEAHNILEDETFQTILIEAKENKKAFRLLSA